MVENNNHENNEQIAELTNQFNKETSQRKLALLCSLMGNLMFVVTAYTILCYDQTGQLFGQLLGL